MLAEEIQQANPVMNERIVIVGLGETGLSVARFLHARGIEFSVVDSRDLPPGRDALRAIDSEIELHSGNLGIDTFAGATTLIVSPGIATNTQEFDQARASGVGIIGDIELFARHAAAPVIAITGSNGKSTVTTLLAEMAKASGLNVRAGGNLMPPALDLLSDTEPDLYVLELSSFQLETTTSLRPAAAVVLNVSEDHMDRYTDIAAYARAKAGVYTQAAIRVINRDDAIVSRMFDQSPRTGRDIEYTIGSAQTEGYGLIEHNGIEWLAKSGKPLLPISSIRIPGRHNISNALASLALGEAGGLKLEAMLSVLESFPGLPHRCQWVIEQESVRWFNDSKGTNVGATLAALDGLPGKTVLIAGGVGKSADFRPLREVVEAKARALVLIGRDAAVIESQLSGSTTIQHAEDMQDAVVQARGLAQPGDNVLLSPACASFDMYQNYQQRGDDFVQRVLAMYAGGL